MPIEEEEIARRPVTRITATRRSPILDEVGGPPLEIRHLEQHEREPGFLLVHELRVLCGSLDRSGSTTYSLQPLRGAWRCLRDVSPELITHTVRRVERCYPSWRLSGSGDVYEQLDEFLS
jgi:hypothetical protein